MPVYCYRRGRKVLQRVFSVSERPASIVVGGKTYTRSPGDEWAGQSVPSHAGWPIECVASGVAPDQAGELRKYLASRGVPTEVTSDGNPVYRDAAHRRKALKARGIRDRASYI